MERRATMDLPHLHFTSLTPRALCGDIVESYRLAAERLGYPTSYTDCTVQPGVINVLFFFWSMPWEAIAPYHPDCIVVNFEPMVPGTHAWRDSYLNLLKQCYLWEYSRSNFQRNRELGLRVADYVPLAYEEGAAPVLPLEDVLPDAEQDIDVVFFGSMTQRRVDLLHALMARGVRLVVTNGRDWSVEERDGYLRRAKLVLNFHNWDNSRVVEIGRLSILFRQRKAVVCELYPDSEIDPILRDAVVGAPYDALVDTVLALLADPVRRAALERAGLPLLRRLSQTAHVGPALQRFLRWRRQQDLAALPAHTAVRIAACAHIACWNDRWATTFGTLAAGTADLSVVVSAPAEQADAVADALAAVGVARSRVLPVPAGIDAAAARNWAQQEAMRAADALLFCEAGQSSTPVRVQRLAAFLEAHPDLSVVSHWLGEGSDSGAAVRRRPELDHEIKAELLGTQPLVLAHCLVRTSFLVRTGIRHDAEFTVHGDLHLLCRSAAAGARFAVLAEALMTPDEAPAAAPASNAAEQIHATQLATRARSPWMRAVFSHLTQDELALLGELHAHWWAPEATFAEQLLTVMAKGCLQAPHAHGTERETLARVFRREAVRLLTVFARANLIDQAWIDARFALPDVAEFLAPASAELPVRPSGTPALGASG